MPASPSRTPGSQSLGVGGRRWRVAACDLLHRFEVVAVRRSPYLDDDRCTRLCDPSGLAQRSDEVGGEEEGVEPGDEVEAVVVVGKPLHLADAQVGLGDALACDFQERLGGVQSERQRAALGHQAQEDARAAADIEDALPRSHPDAADRLLVRDYAQTPVRFQPFKSELLLRLLSCDLVGEAPTRASAATIRADIDDLMVRLEETEERAPGLPHRQKSLLLVTGFLRRLLDLHLELVDEIERELDPLQNPSSR